VADSYPLRSLYVLAAALTLVVAQAWPARAQAQGMAVEASSRQLDPNTLTFILGNVQFVLLHELAHFVIDEKDVPVLGPEENAADYIAALMLIRGERLDEAGKKRALQFLLAAADAFSASWDIGSQLNAEVPYWGAHALSIQRYYQIACLLYGSDPVTFKTVPERAALPPSRASGCVREYQKANRAIQWLLDTFGRRAGDAPGAEVIRSSGLFTRTLDRLRELFVLERPVSLVMRQCHGREAAWIPERRELVLCYELVDALYFLSSRERAFSKRSGLP
jgi:hypothetical protein